MGLLRAQGVGLPKDPTAAVRDLHLACSLGAAAGCSAWGEFLAAGKGTPRDEPAALALYERACQNGIPDACALRGAELVHGVDLSGDATAAHQWFGLGCARGSRVGCHNMAALLLKGAGCRVDPAAAAGHLRTACNGGYAPSCTGMAAQAWSLAKPDTRCPAEAVPWLAQGCAVGDPEGCYWLGRCRENPVDGQRNVVLAAQAYREACEREHGQGCRRLSQLYASGEVAAYATPQTTEVHERACRAGDAGACREVGLPAPASATSGSTWSARSALSVAVLAWLAAPVPHFVLGAGHPIELAWPIRPVAYRVFDPSPGQPLPLLLLLPSIEPQYRVGRGWRLAGILRAQIARTTASQATWGLVAEAGALTTTGESFGGVIGAGIEYGLHRLTTQLVGGLGIRLTRFEDRLEAALVLDFHAGGVVAGGR
ncbi:MAG: sel1 repeat family protein [Deltaproteobacteria bacterium]|nr:sel1 repeat family protein [Deltaproteobacteria bacterium]